MTFTWISDCDRKAEIRSEYQNDTIVNSYWKNKELFSGYLSMTLDCIAGCGRKAKMMSENQNHTRDNLYLKVWGNFFLLCLNDLRLNGWL